LLPSQAYSGTERGAGGGEAGGGGGAEDDARHERARRGSRRREPPAARAAEGGDAAGGKGQGSGEARGGGEAVDAACSTSDAPANSMMMMWTKDGVTRSKAFVNLDFKRRLRVVTLQVLPLLAAPWPHCGAGGRTCRCVWVGRERHAVRTW
jgi:hypothetical protein